MHATTLPIPPSLRAARHEAADVSSERSELPYFLRSIRYREAAGDLSRLWDPSLLERLHAPLTRYHE